MPSLLQRGRWPQLFARLASVVIAGLLLAYGAAQAQTPKVKVLGRGTYMDKYPAQYLRLTQPGKGASYVIWFPPTPREAGGKAQRSVVLLMSSYAGIDWTSETVDRNTEQLESTHEFTLIPDASGPGFSWSKPTYIPYDFSDLNESGGLALPYLINGMGAVVVFHRFYTGGSLQNDIDETMAALEFLRTQAKRVDTSQIAVWGGSWGGALGTHAAANVPDDVKPAYGVAAIPLLDIEQWMRYLDWLPNLIADPAKVSYWRGLVEPHVRRIRASPGPARGDYSAYTGAVLTRQLKTRFLFMHDVLDTLTPFGLASEVMQSRPDLHELFLFPHMGEVIDWNRFDFSHAPVTPGFEKWITAFLSHAYLLTRLSTGNDWILLPTFESLTVDFFPYMRQQHLLGFDVNTFLVPRLLDLCDPRLYVVDYEDYFATPVSGRAYVADKLRTYWGVDVDEDTVTDFLRQGLL